MNTNDFFISHATADAKLVSELVDFMDIALNVDRNKIYCTSGTGTRKMRTGNNFIENIKENVIGTKVVIFIFTPNYFKSNFCLAELGAAWALSTKVYPIIIPPTPRNLLKSTPLSESTQALTLNTYEDLITMAEEFKEMHFATYNSINLINERAHKLMDWIKENCSFDIEESVSKAEHSAVQEQLEGLKREIKEKQMEIAYLTAYYEKTLKTEKEEKAKGKFTTYLVDKATSNLGGIEKLEVTDPVKKEEEGEAVETTDKWVLFGERVEKVKSTISQLNSLVLSAIYYDSFHGMKFWPITDIFFDWEEMNQLESENMIHVDRDDRRVIPNYDKDLVRQAEFKLHELLRYTLTDIDEEMKREFAEEYKFHLDFNSKEFWGKILSVYIYE